jgi:uncharacterized membrane protein YedE/YeeE
MKRALNALKRPLASAAGGARRSRAGTSGATAPEGFRVFGSDHDMSQFTPWSALAGGALIGLAASLLLVANGRVAGVSGIVAGLLTPRKGEVLWRAAFVAGLVGSGLAAALLWPSGIEASPRPLGYVALAGVLVGVGTRLGSGCTSGHGVCGLARLSVRSLAATLVFMGAGMIAATLARTVIGS